MKSKIIITLAILVLIGATAVKLMSNKQEVEAKIYRPDINQRVLVKADTIAMTSFQQSTLYTGTFAPNREAMIIPQVQGQVRALCFEEGDQVRQGKLLVQIDDDLLQARRIAAEANYHTAARNLERYEKASQSGGVSGLQVDNSQLSMKSADSELRQINKQIALSRVTAPFSGTITWRDVELGSVVGNAPIARITDMSQLKLEIDVPENEIAAFRVGMSISLECEMHKGKAITGRVEYVAVRGDEAHTYLVRIVVNNTPSLDLKAGMYGTAMMQQQNETPSLAIPREALIGSAKSPQVFVIENGKAVLRDILTGKHNEDMIEVLEGLQPGDVIITSGHINLENGSPIQIAQ